LKRDSPNAILRTGFENFGMLIGYARVSTDEQSLTLQREALTRPAATETLSAIPLYNIRCDLISGRKRNVPSRCGH
jgi:DNA invertase Pin-like site-specific DNA recombinase